MAKLKFVQGVTVGDPGVALFGTVGASVTVSAVEVGSAKNFKFRLISSPLASALVAGDVQDGLLPTYSFTPDVRGGYLFELQATDAVGHTTTTRLCFGVKETDGKFMPSFAAKAEEVNFEGNEQGWSRYVEAWLRSGGVLPPDTYGARPASATEGVLYYTTDGYGPWVFKGGIWRPIVDGVLGWEPPSAAGYTVRTHAGVSQSIANSVGALTFLYSNNAGASEEVRVASKVMPAGAFSLEAHIRPRFTSSATSCAGIGFRESSTGNVEQFIVTCTSTASATLSRHRATASNTGTSPNYSFSAQIDATLDELSLDSNRLASQVMAEGIWLRITDDRSGNRAFQYSYDHVGWRTVSSFAVTSNAFLTANESILTAWTSGGSPQSSGTLFLSLKEN